MPKALFARLPLLGTLLFGLAGCTVQSVDRPGLSGPSEFGQAFSVLATPDSIPRDGASTSSIIVRAFNSTGAPKSGVTFRMEVQVGGVPVEHGLLSSKTLVTGADGTATTVYTAPPAPPVGTVLDTCRPHIFSAAVAGECVDIVAVPVGSDFNTASTQSAQIHLVPRGDALASSGSNAGPAFVFSPSAPKVRAQVTFDASASRAADGHVIDKYQWTWGDGESSGVSGSPLEEHDYQSTGIFTVVLTITDETGQISAAARTIIVAP